MDLTEEGGVFIYDNMMTTTSSPQETRIDSARFCAKSFADWHCDWSRWRSGSWQTCFTQGFMDGVGVDSSEVSSPTFAIVHEYEGRVHVFAWTCIVLKDEDLPNLCLDERIDEHLEYNEGIVLVEWANKHPNVLPPECRLHSN